MVRMTTDMLRLLRNICGTPDDDGYVPVCHSHNPVILFSFMTYQRICNENNTTGATSGAETSQPFPENMNSSQVFSVQNNHLFLMTCFSYHCQSVSPFLCLFFIDL